VKQFNRHHEEMHPATSHPMNMSRRCPLCGYPVVTHRCNECGQVLEQAHDDDLLRHSVGPEAFKLHRLVRWLRILLCLPAVALFSMFAMIPLQIYFGWTGTNSWRFVILLVLYLSIVGWQLLAWRFVTLSLLRGCKAASVIRIAYPIACAAPLLAAVVLDGMKSATGAKVIVLVAVIATAATFWGLCQACVVVWSRTRSARYVNGTRRIPSRWPLRAFTVVSVVWCAYALLKLVPSNAADALISSAQTPTTLATLFWVAAAPAMAFRFADDVHAELRTPAANVQH